jgi:succinate-semialdehyde dehydrogenase / glutarate-semialdehyde dehydrogenase
MIQFLQKAWGKDKNGSFLYLEQIHTSVPGTNTSFCAWNKQASVPGTNTHFCTWNKYKLLYLEQIQASVPGTNTSFCTWNKYKLLCLEQIQASVPGTNTSFCTWNKYKLLYLEQIQASVPGTNTSFCAWNKYKLLCLEQIQASVPGTNSTRYSKTRRRRMENYQMIINGEEIGSELSTIEVVNPATNEVLATVPNGGRKEAESAVHAAHEAFREWAQYSAYERSELITKWHSLINENKEDLAHTMTREQGKPFKEALGEVNYANGFISWYAEEGKRVYGETIPATQRNKRLFVQKQPVGVVAVITPWNFPAAMITRKVAPALATGCTVVIKPAEQTPLTAIKLAQLAEKAGIPKGVVNVVTGDAKEIGETWLEDTRVRKLTFTGSTEVGRLLMRGSAETVKKVSLELGGHAPVIVMDDCNIDKAVDGIMAAKFRNAGQTCVCSNRIYVHESIEEEFTEKFTAKVKVLKVGNGLEEGVEIGPLIDEAAVTKVRKHVEDAVNAGAKIVSGGNAREGLFFEPTVLTNVSDDMLCMQEETFGPLAPITTFTSEDEAVARANNSIYGLAAYVFTENITKGIRVSEQLEYGIVGLNDGMPSTPQAPFGGFKQSGLGREGGHHGIEEYLEVKYISVGL